ncbi:Potassium transporter [Trichinella spiralis]|uniref:Potassium transporter n=1 Tax=Trichinella spiralis TaxID=6334 RepID=A0ABR3KV94_TRISP
MSAAHVFSLGCTADVLPSVWNACLFDAINVALSLKIVFFMLLLFVIMKIPIMAILVCCLRFAVWENVCEKRYRNEYALHTLTSSNWRASLVPAAAVIPAPIAQQSPYKGVARLLEIFIRGCCCCSSLSVNGASRFYFEKIRVLKAGCDA